MSGQLNSPGGGIIALLFIYSKFDGLMRFVLLSSLNNSTANDWEFSIASTSAISVQRASSFKLVAWVLSRDDRILPADRIYLSHTPPMLLAAGVFLIQTNQSVPLSWRKCLILIWSISWKAIFNSFSAPTKLLPLSLLIIQMLPFLAILLLSAIIKESVPMVATTSMCTALLAKHVNYALYFFNSLRLSFTRKDPKM